MGTRGFLRLRLGGELMLGPTYQTSEKDEKWKGQTALNEFTSCFLVLLSSFRGFPEAKGFSSESLLDRSSRPAGYHLSGD